MTKSLRALIVGAALLLVTVMCAYRFDSSRKGSPIITATSRIDSRTEKTSNAPADAQAVEPVNPQQEAIRSVEQMNRLEEELAQAAQSGSDTEFGPLLNRVAAAVPSEPSYQFDQVIEQLIRFAQRGRRLSDDQHRSFPAESARRLLPIYQPRDHLMTRSLVGQLPADPLDDGKDWETTRQADLDLNLRVWSRARKKIDLNYDPEAPENYPLDFGTLPVPDPLGRYQPGTLPAKITQPDIRTAYEHSRARNLAKGVKRLQQHQARELERMLHEHVEYYLPRAFAYPPDKINTIVETLAKYDFQTEKLDEIQAAARRDLAIVMKARERDAANKKYLDELRATGRLKD